MKIHLEKNESIRFSNGKMFIAPEAGFYHFKGFITAFCDYDILIPLGTGPDYEDTVQDEIKSIRRKKHLGNA